MIGREISDAMDRDDVAEVRRLLSANPQLLRTPDGQDLWLWRAALAGRLNVVQLLVELGLGVDESNDKSIQKTAIDSAASQGHVDVVRWLLDHGATVNHQWDGKPWPAALTNAARGGHLEIVKLLVDRGADVHASLHCMNALMHADDCGQQAIVDYLRSVGAKDLRETTPPDCTAAHERILARMSKRYGSPSDWCVDIPGDPKVGIRHVQSTAGNAGQMLFTIGLSDRRLPRAQNAFACGELRLALPPSWSVGVSSSDDSGGNWPVEWLKRIVAEIRLGTRWPDTPVVFPRSGPLVPFHSDTKLCGWVLLPALGQSIQSRDCRWIDFHDLYPVYEEELRLVLQSGHESLVKRFQARGLPLHLDVNRPNVAGDPEP